MVLNLAIWFAIHTVFHRTSPVAAGPFRFDAPVLASIDPWALVLSAAAIIAMFRFNVGAITTLLASSLIGAALYAIGLLA